MINLKKLLLASIVLLIHLLQPSSAQTTAADILPNLNKEHPRLLATAADFERISRATNDPLQAEIVRRVIATAEETLHAPLTNYELSGTGSYRYILPKARSILQKVGICSAAYRLTMDLRFADRAKKEMLNAAGFPDWNPAHFLDTGELCMALAIGYDWIYETLSPVERQTIKTALKEKGLSLVPAIYDKPYSNAKEISDKRLWWIVNPYNWNQVCHAGLLAASLALADEEPDMARKVVLGVLRYLPIAMHSYAPDGAWPEGPGYWGYGTTFNVLAIAMLESALGSDMGLETAEPAFAKTAIFRMQMAAPNGVIYNYADVATNWETGISPAFGWLSKRYGPSVTASFFRQSLHQQFALHPANKETDRFFPFHLFWLPPAPKEITLTSLDAHFQGEADVAVFRSAWNDPDALFFGFKAGTNGVNHGHLDVGSFILDSDGERWSAELGPDDYNLPAYFGNKRWEYYRLINFAHSTITPGTKLQDTKATAPIIFYTSNPAQSRVIADLTPAYPGAAEKFFRAAFFLNRARVLVQDDITGLSANTPLNWRMVTSAQIAIDADGRTATLTQNGKTLRAEILSPANAIFTTASAKPPTAIEKQNDGMSILLATVPPSNTRTDVRLAVLLTPVGPKWPVLPHPKLSPLYGP